MYPLFCIDVFLLGQGIGKHRHFVFIARFVHLCNQLLECCHVLCQRSNDLGYILLSTHHDKLELP